MSKNDPPAKPIKRSSDPVSRDDRELLERIMFGPDRLSDNRLEVGNNVDFGTVGRGA